MMLHIVAALALTGGAPAPRVVKIVGMDYAFRTPATIASGPTSFHFDNTGKQNHELNIVLLKRGATMQQFIARRNAGKPTVDIVEAGVGVLFAAPGKSSPSALYTDLLPDRDYVVLCIFRDSPKMPRHHQIGMFSLIHPVSTPALAVAPIMTDTIIGRDYAYTMPATMAAGRHHLAFTNAGKQRHEINVSRLRPGITLAQYHALDAKGVDVNTLIDQNLGVLHSPGGVAPVGRLEVDLVAGREYVVECSFKDTDNSIEHFKLGMSASFKAVKR